MISRHAIESVAAGFWAAAGGRESYGSPVAIAEAVAVGLKIAVVAIDGLTYAKADAFFRMLGGPQTVSGGNRALHGLIVADQDTAFLFVDDADSADERRVTVAHEAAHFIMHYQRPRERARQLLGGVADEVLNRRRAPTMAERVAALLQSVPLDCYRHGDPRGHVDLTSSMRQIEDEADLVALEILAPLELLRSNRWFDAVEIAHQFGMSPGLSELASRLSRTDSQAPNVIDLLRDGLTRS